MRSKILKAVSISMMVTCIFLLFTSSVFAASNKVDVYSPNPSVGLDSNDSGVNYPRLIRLNQSGSANGTLLTTFEQSTGSTSIKPVFPIYRSTDDGKTWTHLSDIVDTQNNWGMLWEPQLFEMPQTIGNVPAGTILAAGLSAQLTYDTNGNLVHRYGKIELYRSDDHGLTWQFMSHIAAAGDYGHPIWEPFLIIDKYGHLVCYYSDERQHELHSQKLVHQVSTDGGYTWGAVTDDVALADPSMRPGMPVVSKMGNGQYMMTYEVVGMNANPVHFRFSNDGDNWGDPLNVGTKLTSVDGVTPGSSPYNVWSPVGGPQGTLIVSGKFQVPLSTRGSDYFVNYNYGTGPWYRVQEPLTYSGNNMTGYSHSMALSPDGQSIYHINDIDLPGAANKSMITFEKTTLQVGPGYSYKLVNKNSQKPLAVGGGSIANGADVIQYHDTYGNEQNWYLINAGNGYYGIINLKSNLALSIGGSWTGDGGNAIQWTYTPGDEQLWALELQTNGFYKLKNKNSGRYLNVQGSTADGAPIGQLANNGSATQEWQIQYVDVLPSTNKSNLVTNPGFENDHAWTLTPTSWSKWTNGNDNAAYAESTAGSHSGDWHGAHWNNATYKAYSFQNLTGLANGTYTLRAYVRGSGGQNESWMSAKNFGSSDELRASIPITNLYTQVTIPNIQVTNGQCEIGFWSDANAGNWINFDDVEFFKQ